MSIQLNSSSLSTTNCAPPLDAPPMDAPHMDAPPKDSPPMDSPPIDAPPMDSPPMDAPPMDAQPMDSPPMDAPPMDSPPMDAPTMDSPPMDAPPMDSPPMDAPPIDSLPIDSPSMDSSPMDSPPMDSPSMDEPPMDERLLLAAISGNAAEMQHLILHESPDILLETTPQGSTCLHISSLFGHEKFFKAALAGNQSLLSSINTYGETLLIIAVTSGHVSLAFSMLKEYKELNFSEMILKQDENGDNALHHAIRNGHSDLALELIVAEPRLSQGVNEYNESPMCIAVLKGFDDVFEELLKIPDSSDKGIYNENALHAAVRNGNPG